MRRIPQAVIGVALSLFAVEFASGQTAPVQPPPTAVQTGYVGSNVCRTCHPNVWLNFYKNPHFKSIASGDEPPEKTGCEGCHGPGKAHVAARGGKATIVAFSELGPKQVLDNCLSCHVKDLTRVEIRRSTHSENGVVCTNCHSIHAPRTPKFLLAKTQANLCYECHGPVRAQFNMPFKHRVNEGVVQCSDCHNPHGAPAPTWSMGARPRMTDQALANEEPCLKCHVDLRGPFLFEHAAVRLEGCETCHSPHGSPNARLLKRPVLFTVCLECHNGAGNFGRTADGIPLQSPSHNMADPRFRNCTTCHVRIHGSNADHLFLR
jgi:DmsE family decaheme c-type cytochrome